MYSFNYIEWNESWNVGVPELDDDHKGLVAIINKIIALHVGKAGTLELRSAINKLMKYTGSHLKREEHFLEMNGYPNLNQHKEVHLRLMYDVLSAKTKLLQNHYDGTTAVELKTFLVEKWLVEHIQKEDQEYAKFFREKIKTADSHHPLTRFS
ncbi:MAG: hemerythrin family protein [Magnetococcales bacterium]|nr:hemerythrin family protein [Magnetococcales bacterium]